MLSSAHAKLARQNKIRFATEYGRPLVLHDLRPQREYRTEKRLQTNQYNKSRHEQGKNEGQITNLLKIFYEGSTAVRFFMSAPWACSHVPPLCKGPGKSNIPGTAFHPLTSTSEQPLTKPP